LSKSSAVEEKQLGFEELVTLSWTAANNFQIVGIKEVLLLVGTGKGESSTFEINRTSNHWTKLIEQLMINFELYFILAVS